MSKGHIISITYNTCLYGLFQSLEFVVEFWVCFEHSTHTPRYSMPTPRFFDSEFWVCFKHSTHTPRCSTPTQRFFVSEFWVCFQHSTHTPRCSTPSPLFFFRVLGSFANFRYVSKIPHTHHDPQRSPHDFLFPSFGFVVEFC